MGYAYQIHVMSVAEPAVVCKAAFAAELAVVSESAIDIATSLPGCASNGARLMLQYKNLTRAETLAVMVVAVLGGGAVAGKVVAVAQFTRLLSATKEALFRTRVSAWQRSVKSLVVDVEYDAATLYGLLRCDVDILRPSSLADSGP
jgi:hypothetical protein